MISHPRTNTAPRNPLGHTSGARMVAARPRANTLPWPPAVREPMPTMNVEDDEIVEVRCPPPSSRSIRIASRAPAPARVARESAWQAAARHAAELRESLAARAVLVHAIDGVDLRVIGGSGAAAQDLLGACEPAATDFVVRTLRDRRSLTMCFAGGLPRFAPSRLRELGARRTLVAAPVVAGGACVAIVEILDAHDLKRAAAECERIAALLADVLS